MNILEAFKAMNSGFKIRCPLADFSRAKDRASPPPGYIYPEETPYTFELLDNRLIRVSNKTSCRAFKPGAIEITMEMMLADWEIVE